MTLDWFQIDEFDSPDVEGSGRLMDADFLIALNSARNFAKIPFKINSGYRTKEWNHRVGGRVASSHLKGVAADIHCNNSANRIIIVKSLINAGFKRIGIAKSFIHCDLDNDKPDAIWLY